MSQENEIGHVVCRDRRGRLFPGPVREGNSHNVDVPVKCPKGSQPVALWHTHPSGSLQLSDRDIKTGQQFRLPHVCTSNGKPGTTRCYEIPGRK